MSFFVIHPPVAKVGSKSLAICSAKQSKKATRIEAKIDQKSLPGGARGTQNRPKSDLGASRALQSRPGSVSEHPRHAPGASQGCPGGGPGCPEDSSGIQKGRPGGSRAAPGHAKSLRSRLRKRKKREIVAWPRRNAHSDRFSVDFRSFFENRVFLKSHPLWANNAISRVARRACSRLHATSKNIENRPENRSEIVENCVSGHLGRPFRSTLAARSASVERLGRLGATRCASRRPSRSEWATRACQGARGTARSP